MSEESEWYDKIGRPRYIVAPMVDASELPWRLLCRRHGAQLCYTPMFHSSVFVRDPKYRKDALASCPQDRPLITQFCGNDPDVLVAAARLAEDHCDAIDINLGCPQAIAKRGRYGAFLQDDWNLLNKIVTSLSAAVKVPITCKIRVFEDIDKTVSYALMLQNAGCKLLTVHGRTREQKGPLTGIASWEHIKAVRSAINIPMFANGNIQCLEDVNRCLLETNVDGVMSAEGILTNPALFEGQAPAVWDVADEYLDLVAEYPCPTAYIRGHLFKIYHKIFCLQENTSDRSILASAQNLDDFRLVSRNIKTKYLPYHTGEKQFSTDDHNYNLSLPPWICQPYVRITPEEHKIKLNQTQDCSLTVKRVHEDLDGNAITRKKMKKLRRIMRRPPKPDHLPSRTGEICVAQNCPNPLGSKCVHQLCRQCCRNKCFIEDLDCVGHRILVHTRREMAKKFSSNKTDIETVF